MLPMDNPSWLCTPQGFMEQILRVAEIQEFRLGADFSAEGKITGRWGAVLPIRFNLDDSSCTLVVSTCWGPGTGEVCQKLQTRQPRTCAGRFVLDSGQILFLTPIPLDAKEGFSRVVEIAVDAHLKAIDQLFPTYGKSRKPAKHTVRNLKPVRRVCSRSPAKPGKTKHRWKLLRKPFLEPSGQVLWL